jgi:hypothetical protein
MEASSAADFVGSAGGLGAGVFSEGSLAIVFDRLNHCTATSKITSRASSLPF